jgi:hypothetical protein
VPMVAVGADCGMGKGRRGGMCGHVFGGATRNLQGKLHFTFHEITINSKKCPKIDKLTSNSVNISNIS